jgi:hypothetical protein
MRRCQARQEVRHDLQLVTVEDADVEPPARCEPGEVQALELIVVE